MSLLLRKTTVCFVKFSCSTCPIGCAETVPFVMSRGSVLCLVCFSDKWSPALQIRTVLLSIQALLSAPNPDDPLANDVAEQWKKNESSAIETGEWRTTKLCRVSRASNNLQD